MTELIRIEEVEATIPGTKEIVTTITRDMQYEGLALLVCDLVRHIALAKGVDEEAVWEWVDKERYFHTTEIQTIRMDN